MGIYLLFECRVKVIGKTRGLSREQREIGGHIHESDRIGLTFQPG